MHKEQPRRKAARIVKNPVGLFEVQADNMAHQVLGTFQSYVLAEMFRDQINALCSEVASCNGMENGFAAA